MKRPLFPNVQLWLWVQCLSMVLPSSSASAAEPKGGETAQEFSAVARPLLQQHCVRCHGPRRSEARLRLDKLSGLLASDGTHVWEAVLEQIQAGDMPPKGAKQPSAEARAAAVAWIRGVLAKEAVHNQAHVYPAEGNRVDHDLLFSAKPSAPTASPPRIWRIRPDGYSTRVAELINERLYSFRPWGTINAPGIKDCSGLYRIDEPETELFMKNAPDIVQSMIKKRGRNSGRAVTYRKYLEAKSPDEKQVHEVIQAGFEEILGRKPTTEEERRYGKLLAESVKDFGREKGLELMMSAVLLHPEFVFRFELGGGPVDEWGRRMLTPQELSFAIGYSLRDEGPDEELLKAAREGRLKTRDDVRREVKRMLADTRTWDPAIWTVLDHRTRTSNLLRFFHRYFDYANAPSVFKDDETRKAAGIKGKYQPELLVEETDALVLHILKKDRDVLKELLTTRESFAGRGSWKGWLWTENQKRKHNPQGTVEYYNLTKEQWSSELPLQLPEGQRAGILTQPAWLIAHSTNFENHAILRGKWVRERLLGGAIPDTPITVDAKLPDEPLSTLRHRMRVTRESFCWKCHQKMDLLGLPFEAYDHFGQFRTTELDKPVVSTGAIIESGVQKLDGPVKDAIELLHKLAESEQVEQVFVRHAFRYWMGRNETLADAGALQAAHRAYRDSGGSFKALLIELLSSDPFLYRWQLKR